MYRPPFVPLNPKRLAEQIARHLKKKRKLPPPPTLEEFFPRFIREYAVANRHKPRGIEAKESHFRIHLQPRFGKKRLDRISEADIQVLKLALSEYRPKSVNNVLATLSRLLKTAVRWGLLARMPLVIDFVRSELPEVAFYDFFQFGSLVHHARQFGPQVLAIVLLGGQAGLRRNEIIGLCCADVDFAQGTITVRHQDLHGRLISTKGNRARVVPMTKALSQTLAKLVALRGTRVITKDGGKPLTVQTIRTWMGWAQKAASLPHLGALHVLRHTFCSHLAMRGAPVMVIKELAGHKSLRTTMRYMHLSPKESARAIALLERLQSGMS